MEVATSTTLDVNTFTDCFLIDVGNQLLRLATNQMSIGRNPAMHRAPLKAFKSIQSPNRLLVWRRVNEILSAASPLSASALCHHHWFSLTHSVSSDHLALLWLSRLRKRNDHRRHIHIQIALPHSHDISNQQSNFQSSIFSQGFHQVWFFAVHQLRRDSNDRNLITVAALSNYICRWRWRNCVLWLCSCLDSG